MTAAARERDARKSGRLRTPPYATIIPTTLAAAAARLSGRAVKLLLLAHAAWTVGKPGRVVLPFSVVEKIGGEGLKHRRDIAAAFEELERHGLLTLTRAAVRPGRAGGAKPDAAERALPERDGAPPILTPPHGWRRPDGTVRIRVKMLRAIVQHLAPLEVRVLVMALSLPDREGGVRGVVKAPGTFAMPVRHIAEWLDISPASAARALTALVASGHLVEVEPARGRRPAVYRLGKPYEARDRDFLAGDEKQKPGAVGETQTAPTSAIHETQSRCVSPTAPAEARFEGRCVSPVEHLVDTMPRKAERGRARSPPAHRLH